MHRLFLLGLLAFTVVGVGAAQLPSIPAAAAFRAALAGLLVLLWTYWLRFDWRAS